MGLLIRCVFGYSRVTSKRPPEREGEVGNLPSLTGSRLAALILYYRSFGRSSVGQATAAVVSVCYPSVASSFSCSANR